MATFTGGLYSTKQARLRAEAAELAGQLAAMEATVQATEAAGSEVRTQLKLDRPESPALPRTWPVALTQSPHLAS